MLTVSMFLKMFLFNTREVKILQYYSQYHTISMGFFWPIWPYAEVTAIFLQYCPKQLQWGPCSTYLHIFTHLQLLQFRVVFTYWDPTERMSITIIIKIKAEGPLWSVCCTQYPFSHIFQGQSSSVSEAVPAQVYGPQRAQKQLIIRQAYSAKFPPSLLSICKQSCCICLTLHKLNLGYWC